MDKLDKLDRGSPPDRPTSISCRLLALFVSVDERGQQIQSDAANQNIRARCPTNFNFADSTVPFKQHMPPATVLVCITIMTSTRKRRINKTTVIPSNLGRQAKSTLPTARGHIETFILFVPSPARKVSPVTSRHSACASIHVQFMNTNTVLISIRDRVMLRCTHCDAQDVYEESTC